MAEPWPALLRRAGPPVWRRVALSICEARFYLSILKRENRIGKQGYSRLGPFVELLPVNLRSQP